MMGNERHTLKETENHQEDPLKMMLELKKEWKILKRNSVEEIHSLKIENTRVR